MRAGKVTVTALSTVQTERTKELEMLKDQLLAIRKALQGISSEIATLQQVATDLDARVRKLEGR